MTTINNKLKMTSEEYELLIFGAYARWCESVTINTQEFQKVLANSAINKWFMMEYAKCEADFEQLTARYEGTDTIIANDYKRCYAECTYRMFSIRPMALLNAIKKTPMKINGINTYTLTFNYN